MSTSTAPKNPATQEGALSQESSSQSDGLTVGRLPMPGIAQEVQQEVERMDYPAVLPDLILDQMERARRQITAAAPQPIDTEKSKSDALLLLDVDQARERHADAEATRNQDLYEARRKAAAAEPPLTPKQHGQAVLIALLVMIFAILSLRELMAPSVAEYLLAPYFRGMLGKVGSTVGDERARDLMLYLGGALFFAEIGVVLATSGNLAGWIKAGFFVVGVLVALAFGALRLSEEFSWSAFAISIFEGALLVAVSLFAVGLSSYLARDRKAATEYRSAHEVAALEAEEEKKREQRRERREQAYRDLLRQIEEREAGVRRLDQATELAALTAKVASLTATGQVISRYAKKAHAVPGEADQQSSHVAEHTVPVGQPKDAGGVA